MYQVIICKNTCRAIKLGILKYLLDSCRSLLYNNNNNIFSFPTGLHHQGIFRVSGSQLEINNFRESFERMEDPLADVTDASDINSVAGVLKLYLRELREPLFPTVFFDQFMEIARE